MSDKETKTKPTSLIPTKKHPHPLLGLSMQEKRKFTWKSLSITLLVTFVLYVLPSYYYYEYVTALFSFYTLHIFGFDPAFYIYHDIPADVGALDAFLTRLYDGQRVLHPALSVQNQTARTNFIIVRACTGMQAGSLLLGLIWVTPGENKKRLRISLLMLGFLFIGNFLRIAMQVALTTIFMDVLHLSYAYAWSYAHDWTGRPIGFLATVGFAILIEKNQIRILDTISVWIDVFIDLYNQLITKVTSVFKPTKK